MAIYHLSAKVIKRSAGRSATAAAAYRAAEKIADNRTGLEHDYSRKSGVDFNIILAPEGSPNWMHDREKLWNAVEAAEKRKDAQVAREVEVALPKELDQEQMETLAMQFAFEQFVERGMVADIAIHHAKEENPHAHILLTTREAGPEGFGKKVREWNDKGVLQSWREGWEHRANEALMDAGYKQRIDHRTLEAQGIERVPQIHIGPKVIEMEQRGQRTERGDRALEIEAANAKIIDLQAYRQELEHELNREAEASAKYRRAGERDRAASPSNGEAYGGFIQSARAPESSAREDGRDAGKGRENRRDAAPRVWATENPAEAAGRDTEAADLGGNASRVSRRYSSASDRIIDLAGTQHSHAGDGGLANSKAQVDRTYLAVRRQLQAMGGDQFEVGIRDKDGRMMSRQWSASEVLKSVSWLKRENAKGADIYIRPDSSSRENSGLILVDDLNQAQVASMAKSGAEPALVTETSPDNYQAWVRVSADSLPPKVATTIAKGFAKKFGGDPNSADWMHYGRLAGFTNQKPEHNDRGRQPWVLAHQSTGKLASQGPHFAKTATELTWERELKIGSQKLVESLKGEIRGKSTPEHVYKRQMTALSRYYGSAMDYSRADYMVSKDMLRRGYTAAEVEQGMKDASIDLAKRKAGHIDDYVERTVKAAQSGLEASGEKIEKRQVSAAQSALGIDKGALESRVDKRSGRKKDRNNDRGWSR